MSPVEVLANPVARQLTLALLHFVWQGLAIAVLLVLAVELLKIRRPQARYACSLAALLLMSACPVATFFWIGTDHDSLRASGFIPESFGSPLVEGEPEAHESWIGAISAAQPYALAAWLLGVAIFAGRLSAGAIGVLRLRQQRIPLPLDLASNVERLGRRLQMDALPLVFLSRRVTEAMAVGVVRPLVLIPAAWATEMPLEMLEAVIAHELAHLRRRDLWVNLLQRVAEAVLFYHPAVWWLSRRLRQERELCADALAVAVTGRRLEYVVALEQVARLRQADVGPALAAFMRGGKNMRLLERVRNVLGMGAEGDCSRHWPAGLLILALPLGLWALSLGLNAAIADDERKEGDRPAAEREVERDGDRAEARKEERKDGDAPRKEGPRDGEVKKEGPRDGETPRKEGARDGEVKKPGPRDGDAPKKEGPRDVDAPKKVIKDGDRPIKEGARDGEKKIVKEGAGPDNAIGELKALVQKLMAENARLKEELAAVRGGKEGAFRKEGGDKPLTDGQRKEAELRELRLKKERAAEEREGAERKEKEVERREGDRKEEPRKEEPRKEGAREGDRPK